MTITWIYRSLDGHYESILILYDIYFPTLMEVDNCRLGYVAALDLLMFKRVLPFQIFLFAASLIGTWNE